jgi:hypothetical protein
MKRKLSIPFSAHLASNFSRDVRKVRYIGAMETLLSDPGPTDPRIQAGAGYGLDDLDPDLSVHLVVLSLDQIAGVGAHEPGVTAVQKRSGCHDPRPDVATTGREATTEGGMADRRAHERAVLPLRDGVPVGSVGFPAALSTRSPLERPTATTTADGRRDTVRSWTRDSVLVS